MLYTRADTHTSLTHNTTMALTFGQLNGASFLNIDLSSNTGADCTFTIDGLSDASIQFELNGQMQTRNGYTWASLAPPPPVKTNNQWKISFNKASYPGFTQFCLIPRTTYPAPSNNMGYWGVATPGAGSTGTMSSYTIAAAVPVVQNPDTSITVTVVLTGGGGMED
jgi:hypothetical protein